MVVLMSTFARITLALFLAAAPCPAALAFDNPSAAASQALVPFASDEGLARLARSSAKVDFPVLANQYEEELDAAFGPASAAMVLNAVKAKSGDLPKDDSRLHADDLKYLPPGLDPIIPRYTQDNVLVKSPKTRAQVLGEPVTINGKQVHDFGFQVRQLDALLRVNGLSTKLVIVDDAKSEADIRADLIENLEHPGDYVIISYLREAVGQPGPGHLSPLGAYDAESDSFLVLDVNPSRAGWVWMPTATLIKGMRTFDTVENRGYIVAHAP
jgi:phytochelatin synthase